MQTQTDWGNFCRDICKEWLNANPNIIGGCNVDQAGNMDPAVVEIDESYFICCKYNRGCWLDGHWVFGGIGTRQSFLLDVPDRTRPTLEALVQQYILPGTPTLSRIGWASYHETDQIGSGIYTHMMSSSMTYPAYHRQAALC